MTYETLYNYFTESLKECFEEQVACLTDIEKSQVPLKRERSNIIEAVKDYTVNENLTADSNSYFIKDFIDGTEDYIRQQYIEPIASYKDTVAAEKYFTETKIKELKDQKAAECEKAKSAIDAFVQEKKATLKPLEEMHDEIEALKPEIEYIFSLYNLQCNSVEVDFNKLGIDEIHEILDMARYSISQTIKNSTPFSKFCSLLYLPINLTKYKDEDSKFAFYVSYTIALIILFVLARPYVVAVMGIAYVFAIISNMLDIKERQELLQLAYSVTVDIDFEKFLYTDERYTELQDDLLHAESRDLSLDIKSIQEELEQTLIKLEESNPEKDLEADLKLYSDIMASEGYQSALEKYKAKLETLKSKTTYNLTQTLKEYEEHFKTYKNSTPKLGDKISESKVLDLNFSVGYLNFKDEVLADYKIKVPLKSLIFEYSDDAGKVEVINYMKLLYLNMLANVRVKYLTTTVFDQLELGKDFSEFLSDSFQKHITVEINDFSKVLTALTLEAKTNIAKIGIGDIQSYNDNNQKIGKITLPYKLIIVLSSTPAEFYKNTQYSVFLQNSAKAGIIVWQVSDKRLIKDPKDIEMYKSFMCGLPVIKGVGKFANENGDIIDYLSYPAVHYNYTTEKGVNMMQTYLAEVALNKVDSIPYESAYREKWIPDDKIMTYNTDAGIELCFGLLDGDPSKPLKLSLGDVPAHCLMGGVSGSGKSVTINTIIASLLHMYPPEALELIMVDFKNTEFATYTGECSIPHAKVIAGTTDGEYALSIFEYLDKEMTDRNNMWPKYGVKNIYEFNTLMRKKGTPEKCLPRMLVLIDEFQVMFNKMPGKIIDKITSYITSLAKVARSAGCHLWFTSQSMEGTLSSDIKEQFRLRCCLMGTDMLSEELLGNKAAGSIKERGYMYSNGTCGMDPTDNKMWRIPFASSKYIQEYIPRIREICKERGYLDRKAEFFDEKERFDSTRLEQFLNTEAFKTNPNAFCLGERVCYSTNRAPVNFVFNKDDNENLCFLSEEKYAAVDFLHTIIDNLNSKENVKYLVCCADNDIRGYAKLEDKLTKSALDFYNTKMEYEDIFELLEFLIEQRTTNTALQKTATYLVLTYFSRFTEFEDAKSVSVEERFRKLLKSCGNYNIHVIFIDKEFGSKIRSMRTVFKHKAGYRCAKSDSIAICDGEEMYSQAENFVASYFMGTAKQKFKLYKYIDPKSITVKELVIN